MPTSATACRVVRPGTRPLDGNSTGSPRMLKLDRMPGRRMVHYSPEERTYPSDRVFSSMIGMTRSSRKSQRTKNGSQLSPAPTRHQDKPLSPRRFGGLGQVDDAVAINDAASGGPQRSPRVQITAWHPSIARRQSSGDKALSSTTSTGPCDAALRVAGENLGGDAQIAEPAHHQPLTAARRTRYQNPHDRVSEDQSLLLGR
jgi:hypothetical protein